MTIKQAALLAAVGTAIDIVTPPISILSALMTHGAWNTRTVLSVLSGLLFGAIFLCPLLVFFACVYWDKPTLAIPERLRRPALVVAIAAGLSAAYTAFSVVREFTGSWDMASVTLMRASHPFQWFWRWPLSGLTRMLAVIGVPLFFFTVARSTAEPQGVDPRLKKAAMYAGIVAIVGAIYTTFILALSEIVQPFPAAHSATSSARLWPVIQYISLSWFYKGSLVWFFFLFHKTVPTIQSSQRLSSGE
jgi:hypothetical protein